MFAHFHAFNQRGSGSGGHNEAGGSFPGGDAINSSIRLFLVASTASSIKNAVTSQTPAEIPQAPIKIRTRACSLGNLGHQPLMKGIVTARRDVKMPRGAHAIVLLGVCRPRRADMTVIQRVPPLTPPHVPTPATNPRQANIRIITSSTCSGLEAPEITKRILSYRRACSGNALRPPVHVPPRLTPVILSLLLPSS